MRRDELRRAIELPARRAGLRVEPELVDALVADVEGEPGALPLLSTSLLELWQQRDGRTLRLSDYERAGGVHGAVARLAERAYERLDREQREVARRILLRLAGEGEGDAVVRRRVPLGELEAPSATTVADVLAVLADERLVTVGDGEVEVAHEALLREWPRLRGWLEEDAEGRRLHQHLIHAAREWDAGGPRPGRALPRRAAGGRAGVDRRPRAGAQRARARVPRREPRRGRAWRPSASGGRTAACARCSPALAALLALAVRRRRRRALAARRGARRRAGRRRAAPRRRGAHARPTSTRAAARARRRGSRRLAVDARQPALGAAAQPGGARRAARGRDAAVSRVAVSPDERLVAVGGERGNRHDLRRRHPPAAGQAVQLRGGVVQDLGFSPDGTTLAVAGQEPSNDPRPGAGGLDRSAHQQRRLRIVLAAIPGGALPRGPAAFLPERPRRDRPADPQRTPDGPPSVLRRFDGRPGAAEGAPLRVGATGDRPSATGDRPAAVRDQPDGRRDVHDRRRAAALLQRWPDGDVAGTRQP